MVMEMMIIINTMQLSTLCDDGNFENEVKLVGLFLATKLN